MTPDTTRTLQQPEPTSELGYEQVRDLASGIRRQRADLLAASDDPQQPRLLGVQTTDGRRCAVLDTVLDCGLTDAKGLEAWTAGDLLVGAADPGARSVRLLRDGRQLSVVRTYGAGSRYDQRRFFLAPVGPGVAVEVVSLDDAGRQLMRTVAVAR